MINNIAAHSRGFTLIETLLAVLILATAIAGPLTIASKGLSAALVAKDQTTAFYLAQDAIEFVRFARDTNILSGATAEEWLIGAGANLTECTGSNGCRLDSLQHSPVPDPEAYDSASNYQNDPLFFNEANRHFTYNNSTSNTRTIFSRQVKIITPVEGQADEAQVEVNISWRGLSGKVNTITVREHLLNWQSAAI
jgi:prepilin-type N-terminal cleavage/methylation domain-containing protein